MTEQKSEARILASRKWQAKTVSWSIKIAEDSYPEEAEKLDQLKKEKGLMPELFRRFLKDLTVDEIEAARSYLQVD